MDGSDAPGGALAKRAVTRLPCFLRAVVQSAGRPFSCHVIDFSPLGCRLAIPSAGELSDRVAIHIRRADLIFLGTVVWRDRKSAGVRFDPMDAQPHLRLATSPGPSRPARRVDADPEDALQLRTR
jgi:hypothetical protein